MSLPRAFLDELRERVTLSDIVGKRVRLIRAGREFKACCPFHKEKTPSFTINDQKGFYHCFGCGKNGDALAFLIEHDNMAFMDAVEHLAALGGLQVPQSTPEERERFEKRKSLYDLMDAATKWYEDRLRDPQNRAALDYLRERGLDEKALRAFRIGFAPADENSLRQSLSAAGFETADMLATGLLRESTRGTAPFPFFRDRIIFPVTDRRGRIVAFGGRILPEHLRPPVLSGQTPPKYINSPDTELFHKGSLLYNLSNARQAAAKDQAVILAEGYMDVIALSLGGFEGAVAPLGTALTEAQIEEMWRVIPDESKMPILCFDGDTAGRRAAARALDRILPLLKPDHSVRFAFLPEGQDPDSLIRAKGADAMQQVLAGAISLADMLWLTEMEGRKLDTPETRAGFKQSLEKRVIQIANRDVQVFYQQEIRRRLDRFFAPQPQQRRQGGSGGGLRPMSARRLVNEHVYQPLKTRVTRPGLKTPSFSRERVLLLAMTNHPALFDEFGEALGMLDLPPGPLHDLRDALVSLLSGEDIRDAVDLQERLQTLGFGAILKELGRNIELHTGFAQPGQPADVVREGWQESWERACRGRESGV